MDLINIFPKTDNYKLIKYDEEGLWSITHYSDADTVSKIILNVIGNNCSIVDCTAGIGGNSISFAKYFKKVISIEVNPERYSYLVNNIRIYNINNTICINSSCIEYIDSHSNYDAYFFDPPWGGPDYYKNNNIRLKLDNMMLRTIVIKLMKTTRIIVIKIPFNYDLTEFIDLNYALVKIKNYNLICFY
jgi:16S rRNA G966 N2-methylase RsmD